MAKRRECLVKMRGLLIEQLAAQQKLAEQVLTNETVFRNIVSEVMMGKVGKYITWEYIFLHLQFRINVTVNVQGVKRPGVSRPTTPQPTACDFAYVSCQHLCTQNWCWPI